MAMSYYNRQNPFMYLLESKSVEMEQKTHDTIKDMIVLDVIGAVGLILWVITILITHNLQYCVFPIQMIFVAGFIFLGVRRSILDSDDSEIEEMIFGPEYENINLNNEKLLAHINFYNNAIGKVEYLKTYIGTWKIAFFVYDALGIVCAMAGLFQ